MKITYDKPLYLGARPVDHTTIPHGSSSPVLIVIEDLATSVNIIVIIVMWTPIIRIVTIQLMVTSVRLSAVL